MPTLGRRFSEQVILSMVEFLLIQKEAALTQEQ